jgi:hypothetical protein
MLAHRLCLDAENEAIVELSAMGICEPTGAHAIMLRQFERAMNGDTAAAKFIRECISGKAVGDASLPLLDLDELTEEQLLAMVASAASEPEEP